MNEARKREVTSRHKEDPSRQTVGVGKENSQAGTESPYKKKEPAAYDALELAERKELRCSQPGETKDTRRLDLPYGCVLSGTPYKAILCVSAHTV